MSSQEAISAQEAARLIADLNTFPRESAAECFRYEMMARRIGGAERGVPDAVQWARGWLSELDARIVEQAQERAQAMALEESRRSRCETLFAAGICSNKRYQAFLDTIDDPAAVNTNVPYMIWINGVVTQYVQAAGREPLSHGDGGRAWHKGLTAMCREQANAALSPRMLRVVEQVSSSLSAPTHEVVNALGGAGRPDVAAALIEARRAFAVSSVRPKGLSM